MVEEAMMYVKQRKGWRMSCDVGEAKEVLENEALQTALQSRRELE